MYRKKEAHWTDKPTNKFRYILPLVALISIGSCFLLSANDTKKEKIEQIDAPVKKQNKESKEEDKSNPTPYRRNKKLDRTRLAIATGIRRYLEKQEEMKNIKPVDKVYLLKESIGIETDLINVQINYEEDTGVATIDEITTSEVVMRIISEDGWATAFIPFGEVFHLIITEKGAIGDTYAVFPMEFIRVEGSDTEIRMISSCNGMFNLMLGTDSKMQMGKYPFCID